MAKNTHAIAESRRFLKSGRNLYTLVEVAQGNAEQQSPVSNSQLNVALNADLLDGFHAADLGGGGGGVIVDVTLPSPTVDYRGKLYIVPSGSLDVLYICLGNGSTYGWYELQRALP